MKIYISADIEGVCGTTHWDECEADKTDYSEFKKQMTKEVAAACSGAIAAGAKEIVVQDAHASARNIIAKDYNGKIIASGISDIDDSSVIQSAFDLVPDGGIVYFDNGEYSISKSIVLTGKNLIMQGNKAEFNIDTGCDDPGFSFSGELVKITPLLSDANKGSSIVSLKDISGVNGGYLVKVYNDILWCPDDYPTHKTGEMYTVRG